MSRSQESGNTMQFAAVKLQRLVERQVGRGQIHNLVLGVQSHDREFEYYGAGGLADPTSGQPMETDTPYFIASVSKTFTAAIAMQLHQDNRLDLDAPISEYLATPLIDGIHVYQGDDYSRHITVAHLIGQTSGLPDYETEKPAGGRSLIAELKLGLDREVTTEQAIEIVRQLKPKFPPGTQGKAHYSNANYRLLGEIIQSITGNTMAVNYQTFICRPLGMENTYLFDWRHPHPEKPATFYLKDEPALVPKYMASNVSDGGLVSTVVECLRFLRAFFEGEIFHRDLLPCMMNWNRIFFPMQYGYGLMYFKLPRYFWFTQLPEFIGHSGSTGSFAFSCPSRGLYMAGTVNQIAAPQKPFTLMQNLVRALER